MARARNIKPGFFFNEYLAELPFEARLLFIGLWTLADRRGRLEDRPKGIKGKLFPYDSIDVEPLLQALTDSPEAFIIRYERDGKRYIQIVNFEKHQNPHKNEKESTMPAPELYSASTVQAPYLHPSTRADSFNLIPDSGLLNSDSRLLGSGAMPGAVPAPGQQEEAFIQIPLNDGSMYPILIADIDTWTALYPSVDVPAQLRKIAGWNDAHPNKRKTIRGIKAHINSWLAREQDKGGMDNGTCQQDPLEQPASPGGDGRNQSRYDYVAGTDFKE